jgi:hypothetical protein
MSKIAFLFLILGVALTPVWITMVGWLPVHLLVSALERLLALG